MERLKLFLSNFFIYGLGSIIGKIIPFILLPIIARLMPNIMYFGLNELVITFVSIGTAIAVMGMYDAAFRLFFDKEDLNFKKSIYSTALCTVACFATILTGIITICKATLAVFIFGDPQYEILVYIVGISILVGSINTILGIPTRAQNQSKLFVCMNIVTSIVSYSLAILLLLKEYYVFAIPLSSAIALFMNGVVFGYLNRGWVQWNSFSFQLLKELLKISLPLFPIFIVYWVFNSSDRIIISKFLGNNQAGIYSVGAKVASASQLIYVAFAGGWQYFSFSTMRDKCQVENNSKIYEYLGAISFNASVCFCLLSEHLFKVLFSGEYILGYKVAPLLFIGPLLLMLYQVAGNQFLVIKKTWPSIFILGGGAILNIFLNFFLVPLYGIEGAAISNVAGYTFINVLGGFVLWKMHLIIIKLRFFALSLLLLIYLILWKMMFIKNFEYAFLGAGLYIVITCFLYKWDLIKLYRLLRE